MSEQPDSFNRGIKIAAFVTLVGIIATFGLVIFLSQFINSWALLIAPFQIGVIQLIWIVPLTLHWRKQNQPETVKGIVMFAGSLAILNATCFGGLALTK